MGGCPASLGRSADIEPMSDRLALALAPSSVTLTARLPSRLRLGFLPCLSEKPRRSRARRRASLAISYPPNHPSPLSPRHSPARAAIRFQRESSLAAPSGAAESADVQRPGSWDLCRSLALPPLHWENRFTTSAAAEPIAPVCMDEYCAPRPDDDSEWVFSLFRSPILCRLPPGQEPRHGRFCSFC
jgi:hypothetical protein